MKTRVFFLLAAIGLLASCAKEVEVFETQEPTQEPESTFYVTVGIGDEPESKTSLSDAVAGERKVEWSSTDQIRINGKASTAISIDGENSSIATFTFSGSAPTSPFKALYPASIYKDATHITLPAIQTYKADNIADGAFPMAGSGADLASLQVHNLCAIVKVSVKRASSTPDTDDIVAISFIGHNNEQVSGDFTINYASATLTGASDAASDKEVKMSFDPQTTSTETALDYYLVVPARTYANGFEIMVKDENGDIMVKGTDKSKTFEAGHLYPMKAFEFVPTEHENSVSISSAADLIQFAQDYDNGLYDEPNIPVVTLTTNISGFTDDQKDAFNATGGIGAPGKKFHGTFDGAGYTIADLAVAAPLFSHIGPAGVVKNVELTSTSSITYSAAISADTSLGSIAGYSEGVVTGCVNHAPVVCSSTSRTDGVLYIGGIVGRQYGYGTISDCVNYADVTCTAPGSPDIYMGGIAGTVERPNGDHTALIENCSNSGNVKNGLDSGEPAQPCILHIGGAVGWIYTTASSAKLTVTGLVNSGNVTKTNNSARADALAVLVGGLIGGIHGAGIADAAGVVEIKNSNVKNCRVQTGNFNNKVGYGEASHAGGFVAVARGNQSTKNISFSDNCYVKDVYVICRRGFAGGFVSWARGAVFSGCQVLSSSVRGTLANCYFAGGLAGCAYDCNLSNCIVLLTKEDKLGDAYDSYTLYARGNNNMAGGIVAQARGTVNIDGCKAFIKKMVQGDAGKDAYRGWIVGHIDDNSGADSPKVTIKNCAIGGASTSATAITLDADNFEDNYNDHTYGYFYGSSGANGTVTFTGTQSYWDASDAPSGKKTVDITISTYAADNGWISDGSFYTEMYQGGVTLTASANPGSSNGSYNTQWRFYQARGGGLTITAPLGYSLVKATFTYTVTNTGVLLAPDGSTQIASGGSCDLSGTSAFFTIGNTESATNGQVRFTRIVVEYE